MEPIRVPVAVGVKTTAKVQCPPAGKELPQLFVSEKSPLGVMLLKTTVLEVLLYRVEESGGELLPTGSSPKVRLEGKN
jgi:hypothetical protein